MDVATKAREVAYIFGRKERGRFKKELTFTYLDERLSIIANYFDYSITVFWKDRVLDYVMYVSPAGVCLDMQTGDWMKHLNCLYDKAMGVVDNRQKFLGQGL